MISRMRAGSLTRLSPSASGLCWPDSASVVGSVTVQPWKRRSPVSSSKNRAGQFSPLVPGSIARKRSAMTILRHAYLLILAIQPPPRALCRQPPTNRKRGTSGPAPQAATTAKDHRDRSAGHAGSSGWGD